MLRNVTRCATVLVLCVFVAGCATRFSPSTIREAIALQRGQDPLSVFEVSLGRFTTLLIKSALATADGTTPFAGVEQLQLAVYEAPSESGPALDVTLIPVRGWEPVIRTHDGSRSAMVLIRASGESIGDLVVVGAGRRKVVYGRLRGSLDSELPTTLGDVVREGGPDELRRMLSDLAGGGP